MPDLQAHSTAMGQKAGAKWTAAVGSQPMFHKSDRLPAAAPLQRGAALLLALLTVALVTTLAAAALWQQWRAVEVEAAERTRVQARWILTGALDWARLILREDARAGGADHLAEPWAVPLAEARLSSFLAAGSDLDGLAPVTFLSGQINDLQARLNVINLLDTQDPKQPALAAFTRLFRLLDLPQAELTGLVTALRQTQNASGPAALLPQRADQLEVLGLSAATLARLLPYITLLPIATPVNLNSASAEVIYASFDTLELDQARTLVRLRALAHLSSLADAGARLNVLQNQLSETRHSVSSRHFEVLGTLRLGPLVLRERSLLQRNGLAVQVLWRQYWSGPPAAVGTPASVANDTLTRPAAP